MLRPTLLFCTLSLAVQIELTAQQPQLLADLDPRSRVGYPGHSSPLLLQRVGDKLFFTASRGDWRRYAYCLPAGGIPLRLSPDQADDTLSLVPADQGVVFGSGRSVYFSDGTPQGTHELARTQLLNWNIEDLWVSGRRVIALLFNAQQKQTRLMLCELDKPGQADTLVGLELTGRDYCFMHGGKLFFSAKGVNGVELWVSDGTPAGTLPVEDIQPGPGDSGPQMFFPFDATSVAFFCNPVAAQGPALWRSDGTRPGTHQISPLPAKLSPRFNQVISGPRSARIGAFTYFQIIDPNDRVLLMRSDGTAAGTSVVIELEYTYPHIRALASSLYFASTPLNDPAPWQSFLLRLDPATNKLTKLVPAPWEPRSWIADGGRIYFKGYDVNLRTGALWVSDGTTAGTRQVADLGSPPGYALPDMCFDAQGRLYFTSGDRDHGNELWVWEEGSSPRLAHDIGDVTRGGKGNGDPRALQSVAGRLDATIRSFLGSPYRQRFVCDGNPEDLHWVPGKNEVLDRVEVRGEIFALERHPGTLVAQLSRLRPSDLARFVLAEDVGPAIATQGGTCLFSSVDTRINELVLWAHDGETRRRIQGFGPNSSGARIESFVATDLGQWLVLNEPGPGRSLWFCDGLSVSKLDPLAATTPFFQPGRPVVLDGQILFAGRDAQGRERTFISDGSSQGTTILRGLGGSTPVLSGGAVVHAGIAWFAAKDPGYPDALWRTDGSNQGTFAVARFIAQPNGHPDHLRHFCMHEGELFFFADDGIHGLELWRSDGSSSNTRLVSDHYPGSQGLSVDVPARGLLSLGTELFLAADDGTHGAELWRLGSGSLRLVADLAPGSNSSSPAELTAYRGDLYFVATTPAEGREVFVLRRPGPSAEAWGQGCAPPGHALPRLRAGTPRIGGQVQLRARGLLASSLLLIGTTSELPIALGSGCQLYLDLNRPHAVMGVTAGGGRWQQSFNIPNDPSLRGLSLGVQLGTGPSTQQPLQMSLSEGLALHL